VILAHLCQACYTTHARAQACSNLRRMNVLVKLIWISDTSVVESLYHGDKCLEQNLIGVSNNVPGNPILHSILPVGQLASNETVI